MNTKSTIMNKLFLSLFFLACALGANAGTVSFTVTTPPCNHDGILTTTFTGLTPPLTVKYRTYGSLGTIVHKSVTTLTDVFLFYSGGPIVVIATDGTGASDTGTFQSPPFTYADTATAALCPLPGSLNVTMTGGTAPFTYQWYDAATMMAVGTGNPFVAAGNHAYRVQITDAAGCNYGDLDNIDSFTYLPSTPTYTLSITTTTAGCTNGTATSSVSSGAVFPLTYAWSTGAATSSISGLVTGIYSLFVSDAVGCTASASDFVPQSITINVPVTPTPATCTVADGSVIAFGSGGVPPYTYIWSNGAVSQSQTSLSAGFYDVVATDANGCIGSGSTYVGTSTPIAVTYTTTPTLCLSPSGTATLNITGGTPPYTSMWYTTPGQTGISAIGLGQGDYAFRVTDALGCEQSGKATVPPVDIINAYFLNTPSICTLSTGSVAVTPGGGVAPYSYAWSNGGTTGTISGVPTGLYHVTITDAMGCKAVYSDYLPFNSTLGVGLTGTQATCLFTNDGTLSAGAYGGTTPYHYAWTGGGTTSTIINLPPNIPYWVTVTDALGCTATAGTTLGADTLSSCYCTISGTVYNDINGDCIQDPGEPGINHVKIDISGRGYTFTDTLGRYSYKVPSGTYTVTENVLAYYPLSTCQARSITVTSVGSSGCILPVDFANSVDTIHDMHICTWDYNAPVPGHVYYQATVISNMGTVTEPKIYSGYLPDGQLFAPLAFTPGGYFNGLPGYYNTIGSYPSLDPGNSQAFLTTYNVPTNIPLGTKVVFKDSVANDTIPNWLTDYSPWNNVRTFSTTTIASFDPNFKEVYPKGTGVAGVIATTDTVLEYMVHFQNMGTSLAENIRVVDTLDDNLDWTTLTPIYQSAQGQVSVNISGAKKIATFMFNNINLPTAASEPVTSNGMFTYSIKLKKGLAIGTQIKNTASIYFDYNTPVKTNQTLNTLGSVPPIDYVATTTARTGSFNIFPNPAGNNFNAIINSEAAGLAYISVSDVSGKTLITNAVNVTKGPQTIPMTINQLTAGMYLVNFTQNGKTQTQKLVVIKQ
ncbi:MAG: hypothetical protein JWQ38_1081 [Flavipsychrobacter sp.]|nr:hypothetical protein [Flavipsychrobacter sp.]